MRFYRVLKILKAFVSFFSFNFKIIELNMSSKSNIYCCVPDCTQKGKVDPEGNRVGFFGLPNDHQMLIDITETDTTTCGMDQVLSVELKKGFDRKVRI